VAFPAGLETRLCAYARSVVHFPTALKEFKLRNGWFHDMSTKAVSGGQTDPCPAHTTLLFGLGFEGMSR